MFSREPGAVRNYPLVGMGTLASHWAIRSALRLPADQANRETARLELGVERLEARRTVPTVKPPEVQSRFPSAPGGDPGACSVGAR